MIEIYILVLALASPGFCAPKGISYDQKQTGEYNIQLHLKDFQIIAVVGDDSLGSLSGDYDYNYDYSDFTVKPVTPSTTTIKPANQTSSNSTEKPILSTTKKSEHPYPIISPSTEKIQSKPTIASTVKPSEITVVSTSSTTQQPKSTAKIETITDNKHTAVRGQIPVFLQDAIDNDENTNFDKKIDAVTNIAIVPSEDIGIDAEQDQPTLGEILHYRRCAHGFARDKRGRCRKIRRPPQIPLGITRFASNLAARFRQAPEAVTLVSE